ncbi:Uncharacterised protein [uncultured archaeon]|nr:Uncharacterised protein [uncultured archaeon]
MDIIGLIKGFFIAIFVLLLMSAVPIFIMSNSVKSTLLQPSFYATQLESMNAYQKAQAAILDFVVNAFPQDQLSTYGITSTELRAAFAKQITKDWIKNESTRLINGLIWYMTDQTQGVNLSISLKPKAVAALSSVVASKLGVSESDASPIIEQAIGSQIPDPFDASTLMPGIKDGLKQAKSYVGMFMQFSGIMLIAIIALLVLIFLFTLDMVKFSRTVGWPMLLTGALLAITSFMLPGTVSDMLSSAMPSGSGLSVQTVIDFLRPLFNDILMQSIILIVVSVLLIAFSFVYPMVMKTSGNDKKRK